MVDYTKSKLAFKIKKTLRYVSLYGPRRTWVKVRGQYHMQKRHDPLPPIADHGHEGDIGLLGAGNFAYSNIAFYLHKNHGKVIRGVMDVDIHRAASLAGSYSAAYYTDDAEKVIADPRIKLVYIASNHATHAEYAIRALRAGKSVHIEKPHVVNADQLRRLLAAASAHGAGAIYSIGYNRTQSLFARRINAALATQGGPLMINWFVAGHELDPDHWYFKDEEGGRVLGNLCHWTDFTYSLIPEAGRRRVRIIPARAAQSDSNIAVSYVFGDGSIAAITFSAKGHTFEGVREKLALHRGDVLVSMDDFQVMTMENLDVKTRVKPMFRDHGHEVSIISTYEKYKARQQGLDPGYVRDAANLFLATKSALESQSVMDVDLAEIA